MTANAYRQLVRGAAHLLLAAAALAALVPTRAIAGTWDADLLGFPPPMSTKRFAFKGRFETVVPKWYWGIIGNPMDRLWAWPSVMETADQMGFRIKKIRSVTAAHDDTRGDYQYVIGGRTWPAAEDDGGNLRLSPVDPQTGFLVQGAAFVAGANVPCKDSPTEFWEAEFAAVAWPAGDSCASWMPTFVPSVPADPKDLRAKYRKGVIVPVAVGQQTGLAFLMTYNEPYHHCSDDVTYIPAEVYAACVDTPQGRDTFVLRASTRVFDRLFPVMKSAMDGFRPAPAAGPNCPKGTVARRGSGMQPYVCAAPVEP